MSLPPLLATWDGEAFSPLPRFAKICDRELVVGEQHRIVIEEERSHASHNHFFASVAEAWKNLPDDLAERFQTADHLRKFALIKSGYHDERSVVCASKAEAQRVAAFIRPIDDYAVVTVNEATVRFFTAKSQSMKAMGKTDFYASKQAVLDTVAAMIGVTADALAANAQRAA
jgi:hypothetical protein